MDECCLGGIKTARHSFCFRHREIDVSFVTWLMSTRQNRSSGDTCPPRKDTKMSSQLRGLAF